MKTILIIGGINSESSETSSLKEIAEYVQTAVDKTGKDIKIRFCHVDDLAFIVDGKNRRVINVNDKKNIAINDLVFFRGKMQPSINEVAITAEYLKATKTKFVSSAYGSRRAVGKVAQMFQFSSLDCPVPKTVFAKSVYLPGLISEHFSYPVIVKDISGSHGNNNFLVKDEAELHDILDEHPTIKFMAQEYIPNDGDYRLLVMGERELVILRQAKGETHLNNTSVGGKASLVKSSSISADILSQAHRLSTKAGYEIAGVDVIISSQDGRHYFLEMNSQPQLLTGAVVENKQDLLGQYLASII